MMSPNPSNRPTAQDILDSKYLILPQLNHLRFLELSNRLYLEKEKKMIQRKYSLIN